MQLHIAVTNGSLRRVQRLLARNSDPNTLDEYGRTPLSYAASSGRKEIVQLLLGTRGIDPNAQDKDGRTPLSHAVSNGREEIVRLLLEAKDIDPNAQDKDGRTPLSHAASSGYGGIVRLLLEAKDIDPSAQDKDGRTPLSYAASSGREEIVRLLLDSRGININAQDKNGWPPLLFATEKGSPKIVRMLANATSYHNRTATSWAAEHGHITAVRTLLQIDHTDPSNKDAGGRTPLSRALENGHETVVQLLACVDTTAIHTLIQEGRRDQVQLLLKIQNAVNRKNSRGQTPLHTAIWYNQTGIVEDLIAHGADTNSKRSDGVTPLQLAIQRKDVHCIELLLQRGVQVKGVLVKDWLKAYGRDAQRFKVELTEGPNDAKRLRFDEPKPVNELARIGTSRYLLSLCPWSEFEAEIGPQSLFASCFKVIEDLKSNLAKTTAFGMFSRESRKHNHTLICLGVRCPPKESTSNLNCFKTSWDMCAIAWTITPPTKASDGPSWKSVAHISSLPYGWIPDDGADFFQQLILHLKERWLKLCNFAEDHMSRQRLRQLQEKGDSTDLIKNLAEDAQEWDGLRRILKLEVLTAEEFATKHFNQYNADKILMVQAAIRNLSDEVGDRLDLLDQAVKDLLQFEFAWVSINEAHRSTSIATSMKRLSWITFVFLPAMFASSIFGMNVDILASNPDWRWYILFVSMTLVITILVWLLFKYGQIERWTEEHIGTRLNRWGKV